MLRLHGTRRTINRCNAIALCAYSVRSAAVGEEERADRRRNGLDIRRVAVASVSEGSHVVGTVHEEQMRRRVDHSKARHHSGPLSARVNYLSIAVYVARSIDESRVGVH